MEKKRRTNDSECKYVSDKETKRREDSGLTLGGSLLRGDIYYPVAKGRKRQLTHERTVRVFGLRPKWVQTA